MRLRLDFEEAWRRYVNGPEGFRDMDAQDQLMKDCLSAATTIDQMIRVFNASYSDPGAGMSGIRSRALKKMIDTISTRADAERVYALASKRGPRGYVFPAAHKAVKAKLDNFVCASL